MAARIAQVLPDSTDEYGVLPGRILRHGEIVLLGIIDELDPRRASEDFTHGSSADRALAFESQRDTMGAQHRHAHTRRRNPNVRISEDLARLLHDLGLFLVVARRRIDPRVVTEEIERVRVWQNGVAVLPAIEIGASGFTQLLHCRSTGARSC